MGEVRKEVGPDGLINRQKMTQHRYAQKRTDKHKRRQAVVEYIREIIEPEQLPVGVCVRLIWAIAEGNVRVCVNDNSSAGELVSVPENDRVDQHKAEQNQQDAGDFLSINRQRVHGSL